MQITYLVANEETGLNSHIMDLIPTILATPKFVRARKMRTTGVQGLRKAGSGGWLTP